MRSLLIQRCKKYSMTREKDIVLISDHRRTAPRVACAFLPGLIPAVGAERG